MFDAEMRTGSSLGLRVAFTHHLSLLYEAPFFSRLNTLRWLRLSLNEVLITSNEAISLLIQCECSTNTRTAHSDRIANIIWDKSTHGSNHTQRITMLCVQSTLTMQSAVFILFLKSHCWKWLRINAIIKKNYVLQIFQKSIRGQSSGWYIGNNILG